MPVVIVDAMQTPSKPATVLGKAFRQLGFRLQRDTWFVAHVGVCASRANSGKTHAMESNEAAGNIGNLTKHASIATCPCRLLCKAAEAMSIRIMVHSTNTFLQQSTTPCNTIKNDDTFLDTREKSQVVFINTFVVYFLYRDTVVDTSP